MHREGYRGTSAFTQYYARHITITSIRNVGMADTVLRVCTSVLSLLKEFSYCHSESVEAVVSAASNAPNLVSTLETHND